MENWLKFAHWVYDMQGLLAAVVAAVTLLVIFMHRRGDRLRKLWLAKSEANFAVVNVNNFFKNTVQSLEEDSFRFKKAIGTGIHFKSFNITPISPYPDESIKKLANLIPVSNAKTASEIAELTSFFQIYKSRLSSFEADCINASHGKSSDNFYQRIYEQIELSSWLMQKILPYVRDMKSKNMPDFKDTPDYSLLFDSKHLLHDVEYNAFVDKKVWPPDFQNKMKKFLKKNP